MESALSKQTPTNRNSEYQSDHTQSPKKQDHMNSVSDLSKRKKEQSINLYLDFEM